MRYMYNAYLVLPHRLHNCTVDSVDTPSLMCFYVYFSLYVTELVLVHINCLHVQCQLTTGVVKGGVLANIVTVKLIIMNTLTHLSSCCKFMG